MCRAVGSQALQVPRRSGQLVLLLALFLSLHGCSREEPPIHLNPNMDRQPRYAAQAESSFFYNGAVAQPSVPGTVARGGLVDAGLHGGRDDAGEVLARLPLPVDERLLLRGRERYGIFCAPCHGERGDGLGMLTERVGVRTADLREPRIREMPPGQVFLTVSDGLGLMSGYRATIPALDRWAIVAYLRTLPAVEVEPS